MNIWEANVVSTAYTPHVCTPQGQYRCEGTECGDIDDSNPNSRYEGVCDKDGCDFAPYRLGDTSFFGPGANFTVDTSRKFTIVTQFITADGTDTSDLSEIRRIFIQDGKTFENPTVSIGGKTFSSITDDFCDTEKEEFGDVNSFSKNGGLKAMGESLDRGMVFVMSLWDDHYVSNCGTFCDEMLHDRFIFSFHQANKNLDIFHSLLQLTCALINFRQICSGSMLLILWVQLNQVPFVDLAPLTQAFRRKCGRKYLAPM